MVDVENIIRKGSLEEIEKLTTSNGFLTDSNHYDYQAVTHAIQYNRQDVVELLLSKDCRVNSYLTKVEDTPLHHAVKLASINIVTMLLLKNASITAVNFEGNTPLHLAFLSRYDKIVELMLHYINTQEDSNLINIVNTQGLTHMHIACTNDNVHLVERFLKSGANCKDTVKKDSPYCAGYTTLHFAISHNSFKVARILLKYVNLQIENSDGLTSFQLAYVTAKSSQITFYQMLQQSEFHKSTLYNRLTYFHMACLTNFSDLVNTFIESGAAIDTPLNKEATFCPLYTPLHFAVESQFEENINLLLQAGADVDQRNAYGMSPLHLAMYCEDHKDKTDIVDMLYKATKNKEKNYTDNNKLSYLHIAVTRNDIDLVKQFLDERKEDVNLSVLHNTRNYSGYTPLHFAVRYRHLEMAKLLINYGANVNDNWSEHGTPLHLAFEAGHKEIIDLLLNNGAEVHIKRINNGKTMLHLLVEYYVNDLESRSTRDNVEDSNRWGPEDSLLRYLGKLVNLGCDVNAKEMENGNTALHLACLKFWYGASCAKLLLELGANINAENKLEMTPLECALSNEYQGNGHDYMALYHHVQQLKALEKTVNPKNENACNRILEERTNWKTSALIPNSVDIFSDQELERRDQERFEEIEQMLSFKIDPHVSLREFILLKPKYAAAFVKCKMLSNLLKDYDKLEELYPLYTYLIRLAYWKALRRYNSKGTVRRKTSRSNTSSVAMRIGCLGCRPSRGRRLSRL